VPEQPAGWAQQSEGLDYALPDLLPVWATYMVLLLLVLSSSLCKQKLEGGCKLSVADSKRKR
jgi:hypothetical protein